MTTEAELRRAFEAIIRKGLIIKAKRTRNGQPVYIAREYATPAQIAEQEETKQ